jgi:hypothetical protein
VRCGRFPPIEKDMKMVLAQCGSLLLDPAALQEVGEGEEGGNVGVWVLGAGVGAVVGAGEGAEILRRLP